jgi:hypothetical protein
MRPTRYLCSLLGCLWLAAVSPAATVNFIQNAVNDADGGPIEAVASSAFLSIASTYSTVVAPAVFGGSHFTHWTNSSEPTTSYRDVWGRSQNPISLVLLEVTTATAHYLPAARDTDSDGVPDWYEIEYFGALTRTGSFDGDADGLNLAAEHAGGTHPLYGNASEDGGVAYADSGLVTVNFAGYASYTVRVDPEGTVQQQAFAPPGTVVTTSDFSSDTSFGAWTLDGVRQQDAWGVALPQISFTMATSNREAVANLFVGDSDVDGLPDAYEQYFYATLGYGAASDTDGDGLTLEAERSSGRHPLYADTSLEGGVAYADSGLVTVNFAGYASYTVRVDPEGTVQQQAFAPPGTVVTTSDFSADTSFGYWSLDGARQQDAWGVARPQLSFTMSGSDRQAVASRFVGDSDVDGLPDAYEQYFYATLGYGAASDTDGDGFTLEAERSSGRHPLYADTSLEGGVVYADSSLVEVSRTNITTVVTCGAYIWSVTGQSYSESDIILFTPPDSFTTEVLRLTIIDEVTCRTPVFPAYQLSTLKNQAMVIPVARITSRTSVPNGDAVALTGLVGSAGPVTTVTSVGGGTVVLAGTSITYTPLLDFTSADSFKVLLTGASGGTVEAVVSVNVTGTATPATNNITEQSVETDGLVVTRVQLVFRGIPGVTYVVERSLDGAVWATRQSVAADTNGKILFVDVPQGIEANLPPAAFYRTRLP